MKVYLFFIFLITITVTFPQNSEVIENFDDNSRGWNLSLNTESNNLGFISDGSLNIERVKTQNSSFYVNQNLKVNVSESFSVSTLIHSKYKGWGYQGLVFKDMLSGDYLLFALDSFGIARGFYHTLDEDVEFFNINTGIGSKHMDNMLEIARIENHLVFIHNRKILGMKEIPGDFKGEFSTGFYMSQKQSAQIEYLKIRNIKPFETKEKIEWVFPRKQITKTILPETVLEFSIKEFYMYQEVNLKVNGLKQDLIELSKGSSKLKPFDFEVSIDLKKGVNNILIEYVDHNGLRFKERKYILRKEKVDVPLNHAVLFATEEYENWAGLSNPIRDMDSLSFILTNYYGFDVEIVKNASKDSVLSKLNYLRDKAYGANEQLLVFFAGHGAYDWAIKTPYFVCPESKQDAVDFSSYLSIKEIQNILDYSQCDRVFLMTDICFGGRTRDTEVILDKNTSRCFLASGVGLVSDGSSLNGHSPFMEEFYSFLLKRDKLNLDLVSWVNDLQGRNRDVVFRKFGTRDITNTENHSFQFILK